MQMVGAFAEFERSMLKERTKATSENDCDLCRARHELDHAEFRIMPSQSGDRQWEGFSSSFTRHDQSAARKARNSRGAARG
jgi:hypothetical protein